jgi:hypothetical protein
LCNNSVHTLNFCTFLSNEAHVEPRLAEQWMQHLQENFPCCNEVMLQVQESESYHAMNYLLPALAR